MFDPQGMYDKSPSEGKQVHYIIPAKTPTTASAADDGALLWGGTISLHPFQILVIEISDFDETKFWGNST